jgi:phosphoglycerate dehydrogenase-like enzyme
VTDPQPLPPGHPLWRMPNVVITPHVASWSASTAAWGWVIARENLRRYVAGEPLVSVVDLARGY